MIAQGTPEWFAQRLGAITCSRLKDLMAKTKSGYSTSRQNYMAQLICERLTGKREESYTNAAMEWGTVTEPQARMAYESKTGNVVIEAGFVLHRTIKGFGGSPDGLIDPSGIDGLINPSGMIEIKCPNTATHIEWIRHVEWIRREKVPPAHRAQVQGLMEVCGREWCDFVSFDPRLPEHLQLFIVREVYDAEYCKELKAEIAAFGAELDAMELELQP